MKSKLYNILIKPVMTEKVVSASQTTNTYAFEVSPSANKIEVRHAVEQAFKVKVISVRTAMTHGGKRRFGYRRVTQPDVKRAYVTLAEGDRIDLL